MDPKHIPQFSFEEGALCVASPLQTLRIRWGDPPAAQERTRDGEWRDFCPELRLLKPRQATERQDPDDRTAALEAFRATVPPNTVELVEPFPSHQWRLMVFLHFSKEARDLAASNRVLAYALANNAAVRGVSDRTALCHAMRNVRRKQRAICQSLGFPDSEAMVRLMRKIEPESCSPTMLRLLRLAMARDAGALTFLGQLKRVHAGVVYLVVNDSGLQMITPRLIAQVSESEEESRIARTADMLLDIVHQANQMPLPVKLPRLLSTRAVNGFLNRLSSIRQAQHEQLRLAAEREARVKALLLREQQRQLAREREARRAARRHAVKRDEIVVFPPPPVPGDDSIRPITNSSDLWRESDQQHNCAGSYAPLVRARQCYIYKVTAPQRATLSIVSGTGGSWVIDQLKLAHNQKVAQATRDAVNAWLNRYSILP